MEKALYELLSDPKVRAGLMLLRAVWASTLALGRTAAVAVAFDLFAHTGIAPEQLDALAEEGLIEQAEAGYRLTPAGVEFSCWTPAGDNSPCWNKPTLFWGSIAVKKVPATATLQRTVLNAFETAQWEREIANPFGNKKKAIQQLRGAVRGLGIGQQVLLFAVVKGGRSVSWKVAYDK